MRVYSHTKLMKINKGSYKKALLIVELLISTDTKELIYHY